MQPIAVAAKRIYEERLRETLEQSHRDQFVAIEPESGDHFLADTFDGAVEAARAAHPSRLPHVLRVGHAAALHMGGRGRDRARGRRAASAFARAGVRRGGGAAPGTRRTPMRGLTGSNTADAPIIMRATMPSGAMV